MIPQRVDGRRAVRSVDRPPPARRALLIAAIAASTGCGRRSRSDGETTASPAELTSGSEIDDVIGELWEDGGERALADVTEVDFDELLVFPEGATAERVNEAAGGELLNGEYYLSSSQLFLFRNGGAAVLAARISSDVFEHEIQNATFGPGVRIVAPGGKSLITLED